MAQYLKISSPMGGSCNRGIKNSIILIGKNLGRLANKKGRLDKDYFESGIKEVAKPFGTNCKTPIRYMIKPRIIKNSKNREWRFNKRIYGKAYAQILKLLQQCPPADVSKLLNTLYQNLCKNMEIDKKPDRLYSNALLFYQKDMLELHKGSSYISEDDKKNAGKILSEISRFDRPLPPEI